MRGYIPDNDRIEMQQPIPNNCLTLERGMGGKKRMMGNPENWIEKRRIIRMNSNGAT